MRLGVFVYNFPHQKTVEGLYWLAQWGYDCVCFAQDKKKLNIPSSPTRVTPVGISYPHPANLARIFGYEYHITDHDHEFVVDYSRRAGLSKAVILGARILKAPAIAAFSGGIINMHPGLLPENRGLDNLKWAVLNKIPQGITAHLINSKIDAGMLLFREIVEVHPDDTYVDVYLRTLNSELINLRRAIETTAASDLSGGEYRSAVPLDKDAAFVGLWDSYKKNYGAICESYSSSC